MKAAELKIAHAGAVGLVRLSVEAMAEWKTLSTATDTTSTSERANMGRLFKEFCEQQRYRFNNLQFKKQGDFSDGLGGEVAIWAFKAYQWRLYGFIVHFGGSRCFIGAKVDPAKKSDRADPRLLRAAGAFAGTIEEYAISKGKDLNHGKSPRRHRERRPH